MTTENELPPMAPGGEWLHNGSHNEPLYVHHEAHIKRLLSEGWRPVADPRKPAVEAKPAWPTTEEALTAQLAKALARIEALEAQNAKPETAEADGPDDAEPESPFIGTTGDESAKQQPARKRR